MADKILGIMGAGGLGREVLELAHIINKKQNRWEDIVFVDDNDMLKKVNETVVLGYEEAKSRYGSRLEGVAAVGEPLIRKKIWGELEQDSIKAVTLIHPDVYIPDTTEIGKGVVIQYGCFISCNVKIEDYVYIQPQCNIGHEDVLHEGVMISGFGNIGGKVSIGKNTFLGLSSAIKDEISIGDNTIIGMGSVVFKDIPNDVVVMGNPARPIARNIDGRVRH